MGSLSLGASSTPGSSARSALSPAARKLGKRNRLAPKQTSLSAFLDGTNREPKAFNPGALTDSCTVRPMSHDARAISELLDAFTHALFAKDATSAIAPLADDAVTFDLAPPLQHGPEITHDPARLEEWFRTWKGPIVSEPGERTIVVDENVAYAYGLQRMTGTKTDGEKVKLWFRATACFRRDDGRWRITHMHNSVPFAMDGSDKALLDLKP